MNFVDISREFLTMGTYKSPGQHTAFGGENLVSFQTIQAIKLGCIRAINCASEGRA